MYDINIILFLVRTHNESCVKIDNIKHQFWIGRVDVLVPVIILSLMYCVDYLMHLLPFERNNYTQCFPLLFRGFFYFFIQQPIHL